MSKLKLSQIAGMNLHYSHHTFGYFLESMNRLGIRNIELWAGSPHLSPYDGDITPKEAGRMVRDHGIKIVSVDPEQCGYPVNIASEEADFREKSNQYLEWYIERLHDLGAERLLITSGWGYNDRSAGEAWKRSADSLHRLAGTAERNGVKLLFEILLPCESNIVMDYSTTIRMLRELKEHANVECCLDTVPVCAENRTLADYFSALGSRVTHIHLCDGTPIGHVAWGSGTQDLGRHLKDLEDNGYQGFMTLEMEDITYRIDPEYHVRRSLDVLRNHMEDDLK